MSAFDTPTPLPPRRCIAVLTRGYSDPKEYRLLIERNQCIDENLVDKTIPLLFFHEGNITPEDQTYIAGETPRLTHIFIDVAQEGRAFRREKEQLVQKVTWGEWGYRHMCSFWFVDFWYFVQEYDYMVRIDEDCMVEFSLDSLFGSLVQGPHALITGIYAKDDDFVTVGLNQFTRDFVQCESRGANVPIKYPPGGPYTNLLGIRLSVIHDYARLRQYVDLIDQSDNIYYYRWGDLPLWGEAVTYILGSKTLNVDTTLKYFHGSHKAFVNG